MIVRRFIRCFIAALALAGPALGSLFVSGSAAWGRPATVDDYLKVRNLDAVAAAPIGPLVAVSVSRESRPGDNYRAPTGAMRGLPQRDNLLIIDARDGRTLFELDGFRDGSSAFSPIWSPDGAKLAFLHADRDGIVSLRIWDAGTRRVRTLVADGVRFAPVLRTAGQPAAALAWLSPGEILFLRSGNAANPEAPDPGGAAARAREGGLSVRIWRTSAVPLCRPDDSLAVVRLSDGAVSQVARGALMGASVAPGGQAMVVITGIGRLQPPPTQPLPAHLSGRTELPFVRWRAQALTRGPDGWAPTGEAAPGSGPVMEASLPRWRPDGREWALIDTPDPFAHEPEARVVTIALGGGPTAVQTYPSLMPGYGALRAIEPARAPTADLPAELERLIGPAAGFVGATGSGHRLFRNRVHYVTSLWAVHGEQAVPLLELNGHLRAVDTPTPVEVAYTVQGEPRSGWLFLPPGVDRPPVVVTAYPLTRTIPADALPPEGTFPVLTELLSRGVAVYVADFRIQNPSPNTDEPTARTLSEIGAGMAALRATGRIDAERAAFFGHSFGGYTALNLLAHTQHFRGIVAAAPLGDLAAYAFAGSANDDQSCGAAEVLNHQMMHEYLGSSDMPPVNNLIMKLGGPPYARLATYVRNSPLLDMGRARTPTLIIQGSEDGFPDGQRTFNTLYRLGVDAELLWYWGEGHMISGPANVRDMTERSVEWILEKLRR